MIVALIVAMCAVVGVVWHDVAPRLNSLAETAQELVRVASLYKQGNAAIKAGGMGRFYYRFGNYRSYRHMGIG